MDAFNDKISEMRLKLRRLKASDDGSELLPGIVKLGNEGAALLPELVETIERGVGFAVSLLRDIIIQHKSKVLFDAVVKQYGPGCFSTLDKCYLFQVGFIQFQSDLLRALRELFDRDDPMKFGIVDAFAEAGTVSLMPDLEDIELWTSRRVSEGEDAGDSLDSRSPDEDQGLRMLDAKLRRDFLGSLRQAMRRVKSRPDIALCSDSEEDDPSAAKAEKIVVPVNNEVPESETDLLGMGFHGEVRKHCDKLLAEGNYFHAVSEAVKAYVKAVRNLSNSHKDGVDLMYEAFGAKGRLRVTPGQTETDRNVQEGTMFLSVGLIRAIRNAVAHEPAMDWPMTRQDAMDILTLVSFLYRQLDRATGPQSGRPSTKN
jgi:uncharacterized protein (TIGR02391 family)